MVATGAAGVAAVFSSDMGVCAFLAAKMFGLTRITRGGWGSGQIWGKDGGEGVDEAGVSEAESGGGQFGGVGASAGEQDFVCHFAECQAEGEGGNGEKGRAMELGGKGEGELRVRDRIRGGEVEGAGGGGGIEEVQNGGESVGKRDPAHELTSAAEPAAETEAKNGEEAREGAGAESEDDAEAEVEDADAGVDCGLGSGFPLLAEIGEKAGTRAGGFVEKFVAAVAVDSDRRGDKEHLGRMAQAGQGSGEGAGGLDAALGYFVLEFRGPAMCGEVCAGEVDGGGEVFKNLGVRDGRGGGGIPLELAGPGRFTADELEDGGVTRGKGFLEGRAKHS